MGKSDSLLQENIKLQEKVKQLQETLNAIKKGDVDAVVVNGKKGKLIYSLNNTRVNQILDNISDAFYALDKDWRYIYINEKSEQLSGQTREKLLGKKIWNVFPYLKNTDLYILFHKAADTRQTVKVENYYPHIKKWFEIRIYPFSEGLAVYYTDITKRKQLEKQKDDFIGIASHELKTPVTSIKAYTQVMKYTFEKKGDLKAAGLLSKMDTQLNKLTDLIGDLLDVTKIESGKLEFHEDFFDFDALVKEVIEQLQFTTEKHMLYLHGESKKQVYGDRERIGQVLTNLISNAIKYSPDANKIDVFITSSKDEVQIAVQDFGIGISKEKQEKVFDRFYRVSGPHHQTFPGLGLGLYISSEIIKRQNGRIWVKSNPEEGSRFHFSLPLQQHKLP